MSNQNIVNCHRCHQPKPCKCGSGGGGAEGDDDKKNPTMKDESNTTHKLLELNESRIAKTQYDSDAQNINSTLAEELGNSTSPHYQMVKSVRCLQVPTRK